VAGWGILDFLWFSDVVSDVDEAHSAAVSGRSFGIRFWLVIVALATRCGIPL
jgi:hypothetical protein